MNAFKSDEKKLTKTSSLDCQTSYRPFSQDLIYQIEKALEIELNNSSEAPVAAFDADGTLWDFDLGETFFKYQIEKKLIPSLNHLTKGLDPWEFYRAWKESGDPRPAYLWLAEINKGYSLQEIQNWAKDCVDENSPLPIFEAQKKLIQFFLNKGVQVFVVTASVKWAVEPGAQLFGLDENHVLGVATEVQQGLITNKPNGIITYKEGKVAGLLEATKGRKPFFACGNTMGDFALLESATRISLAVGAAPQEHELFETEEKLREQAKEKASTKSEETLKKWFIHQF